MRRLLGFLAILVLLGAGALVAAYFVTNPKLPTGPQAAGHGDPQAFGEVEYGRYMLTVADCAACHTDRNGGESFAGGRPIETPFGVIVSSNITPDRETGIGSWTDDDFADALQKGFSKDGHQIYPAMPYPYYTHMTRRDVDAIHAYLKTLKPVHKKVVSGHAALPARHPARHAGLESALLPRRPLRARPEPRRPVQPRRLSRDGARSIAAPATRRRRCSAATRPTSSTRATSSRAGRRRTSLATGAAALVPGRSRTWSTTSGRATTGKPRPPAQWVRRSTCPPRG